MLIDKSIIDEYLNWVDFSELPESRFEIVEITDTDKSKFEKLGNEKIETDCDCYGLRDKEIHTLTNGELTFLIDQCHDSEKNSKYNKVRHLIKQYRIDLEEEQDKEKL